MTSRNVTTFGEFIRQLRKEKGLTLTKLAAKLDLDSANLSKMENGIRDFDQKRLNALALIFKLDREDLHKEFISDQIAKKIYMSDCTHELLVMAEEKAEYRRIKRKFQSEIKL